MPTGIAFKLALALAEAGQFDDAERVFGNRFFAREEGGTNVREVYLEVRRLRAAEAARSGRCEDALRIVDRLGDPVDGLPFTRDGLSVFPDAAACTIRHRRTSSRSAAVRRTRQAIWKRLSRAQTTDPQPRRTTPIIRTPSRAAARARRMPRGHRSRMDATPSARIAVGRAADGRRRATLGTDPVRGWPAARRRSGRTDEARERFRAALLAPDHLLSHHIARTGLAELPRPRLGTLTRVMRCYGRAGTVTASWAAGSPAAGPCQTPPP